VGKFVLRHKYHHILNKQHQGIGQRLVQLFWAVALKLADSASPHAREVPTAAAAFSALQTSQSVIHLQLTKSNGLFSAWSGFGWVSFSISFQWRLFLAIALGAQWPSQRAQCCIAFTGAIF